MTTQRLIAAAIAAAFALPVYAQGSSASASSSDPTPMFRSLDKNGDGFISKEEAKGSPHEKAFSQLDSNGDGKLSAEEHAAAHRAAAATGGGKASASNEIPNQIGPGQSSAERTAEPGMLRHDAPTGEVKR